MEICRDCKYYRPVVIEAANVTFHTCPKMGYIFDNPNIVKCKNYIQKEDESNDQ